MKMEYIAPEMATVCFMPAQDLALDGSYENKDFVQPSSAMGGTEIEIPIK